MNRKIKVCFISLFAYQFFDPEAEPMGGGAEWQMSLIAKELAKDASFDVHFAVLDAGQGRKIIEGVDVHPAYRRGRNFFNLLAAPLKLIGLLASVGPDVVVARAAGVEAGLAAFYCRLFRKKFVYSVAHDDDLSGKYFRGLRGKLFKFGLKNADQIVFQTDKQAAAFKALGYDNAGPIIKNSFPGALEESIIDRDLILWIGRGVDDKRPGYFLALAKDFPEERFLMVMPEGDQTISRAIRQSAAGLDNLEIRGRMPFVEAEKLFSRAKVFVNTSFAEGFPNTFLQAAAAGVPILSLTIDPDSLLSNCGAGLVCAPIGEGGKYEKLRDGLGSLLSDSDLRRSLAAMAKEKLLSGRDIAENIKKWKDVIIELLKKKNG
jgi:glycosyltransferase involved in cell wall biosynthesis